VPVWAIKRALSRPDNIVNHEIFPG